MKKYYCGLYLRLSKEDGGEESGSIQSQREILTAYIQQQGWVIVDEYVDDGYSGTSFERPAFKRMIEDIEVGRVNLVITKDLSRLGRNYIQVGYYTEEFFPKYQVRYIALADNYDSEKEEGQDFAPLRNIMNELYARDTSKKIRSILEDKAKKGTPRNTVVPIFGYAYNESYERIPDSETGEVVQLIFRTFIQLGSTKLTAEYLSEQRIKTPTYYNAVRYGFNKNKVLLCSEEKMYDWTYTMVHNILIKEEYLGVYKTAKTKSITYKNKKRIINKDCYVFENRYEPLIDKETWMLAQKMLSSTRGTTLSLAENGLRGLLYCADCGKRMRMDRTQAKRKGDDNYRYLCGNSNCVHRNYIYRKNLEDVIVQEIVNFKEYILNKEQLFLEFINTYNLSGRVLSTDIETDLKVAIVRGEEIDIRIEQLLNQNITGLLPNSTFAMMMNKYKREKKAIEEEISNLQRKTKQELVFSQNVVNGHILIKKFKELTEDEILNPQILQSLIKAIIIKTRKINNCRKKQEIDITIKYYGCDELIKDFFV